MNRDAPKIAQFTINGKNTPKHHIMLENTYQVSFNDLNAAKWSHEGKEFRNLNPIQNTFPEKMEQYY